MARARTASARPKLLATLTSRIVHRAQFFTSKSLFRPMHRTIWWGEELEKGECILPSPPIGRLSFAHPSRVSVPCNMQWKIFFQNLAISFYEVLPRWVFRNVLPKGPVGPRNRLTKWNIWQNVVTLRYNNVTQKVANKYMQNKAVQFYIRNLAVLVYIFPHGVYS